VQTKSGTGSLLAYTRSCYETRPVSLGFSSPLFYQIGDGLIEDVVRITREFVQDAILTMVRIIFFLSVPFLMMRGDAFLIPLVFPFLMTF
jgi:hypothetical protein